MNMKSNITRILFFILLLLPVSVFGQKTESGFIAQGTITSKTDGALIGVNIAEVDNTNRVINGGVTDINGHYVIKIKNPENHLTISYTGYVKQTIKINNAHKIDILMAENAHEIKELVVKASRMHSQGGYSIPQREIASAMQTLDMKDMEGVQVTSVDEALQGRIAGLDIVSNSGDPGSGSSMRIRGASSINGSSQPLIVLNGVPFVM